MLFEKKNELEAIGKARMVCKREKEGCISTIVEYDDDGKFTYVVAHYHEESGRETSYDFETEQDAISFLDIVEKMTDIQFL